MTKNLNFAEILFAFKYMCKKRVNKFEFLLCGCQSKFKNYVANADT